MSNGAYLLLGTPIPSPVPVIAPRVYCGNMCGVRVAGAPQVAGGADDPSLILSWFIDRYDDEWQMRIKQDWFEKSLVDVLVSWPDSQAIGQTPLQFVATCADLCNEGWYPCVFLCAKPDSSADIRTPAETLANIMLVLPLLIAAGVAPRVCIGWELSLWLTPTDVQMLIDAIAPLCTPTGIKVYVHFQERYMSFPQPGGSNADFWNLQVGKLTGVLLQKPLAYNDADYLDWLHDCLDRAAGNDNMPAVLIDGHGVDLIALELNAQDQFNGTATEADGNRLGQLALNAPAVSGPAGTVKILGSGNGE